MNNQRVGELTKLVNGAHTFGICNRVVVTVYARPSLCCHLQRGISPLMPYLTSSITCYPIARRYVTGSLNVITPNPDNRLILLSKWGTALGAVTLIPEDETVTRPDNGMGKAYWSQTWRSINGIKADIPLGMIRENPDFRISVAGAQEKTALLRIGNDGCIPSE